MSYQGDIIKEFQQLFRFVVFGTTDSYFAYNVSMIRQITTVSTKGQFVIPSAMRSALGIKPGTRIAVTHDGAKITLEPVTDELVEETRGMLKGKAHSAEKLRRKWRREDRW
jgi:AbrB family looped-hinge helix DNA binding protein